MPNEVALTPTQKLMKSYIVGLIVFRNLSFSVAGRTFYDLAPAFEPSHCYSNILIL